MFEEEPSPSFSPIFINHSERLTGLMEQPGLHVLVVDDEKDIEWLFRQHFRKEIRSSRLSFHFALSGEEAISYLQSSEETEVVLILSDINMPGMTGLELLQHLHKHYSQIPVHMITAYGDESTFQQAMEFGAIGVSTKPLDFSQLKSVVQLYLH